jgi:hypothetical protein
MQKQAQNQLSGFLRVESHFLKMKASKIVSQ